MYASTVLDRRAQIAFGITLLYHARNRFLPGAPLNTTYEVITERIRELEEDYGKVSDLQAEVQRPQRSATGEV